MCTHCNRVTCSCNSVYLQNLLYGVGMKSTACVALVLKAANDIRITSFGVKKINELLAAN
jgi:hypothetical protein